MNKVKTKKLIFILLIALFFIVLFNVKVYADDVFSLSEENVNVLLNRSYFLSWSGGSDSITWTSADPSIATVNDGKITGLKIGTTTITATRGTETASCTVNVVYNILSIRRNTENHVSNVVLFLGEHPSETLIAKVEDGNLEEISNPNVSWTSSDPNIVTVDNSTGTITAVKAGKATITASAAGVSDTCEVTVYDAPIFTDFSNAEYKTTINWTEETLQITGITPSTESQTDYYYIITPDNSKPNPLIKSSGALDLENMDNSIESFWINTDENYIYTRNLSKYAELNQDLYIWILQTTKLPDYYYDANENPVVYSTKFVVEGKKLTRAELPKLNLILQTFDIGSLNYTANNESDNYTYINFNFPTVTEKRKFTLKIGKVTDNSILSKIQNNDYSGITDLLSYAKSHESVYSQNLTTTDIAIFKSPNILFDGNKLLEDRAYYYIYAVFDDENGKYYPIEGITLGQAYFYDSSSSWDLWGYTSSNFNWDNLSPSYEASKPEDSTIAPSTLPKAGKVTILTISITILTIIFGILFYKKYSKLKDIN